MELATFFDHFETYVEAPGGVAKLREMILQLAVQGKLVPQDPTDEPASMLLSKAKRIAKPKLVSDDDKLFELPDGWIWIQFGDVFDIQGGTQPPKSQFSDEPQKGYVRLLQIRDFGSKPVPTYVPRDSVRRFCDESDVMLGRYGASVGKIFMGKNGAYNVALARIVYDKENIYNRYVYYLLKSNLFQRNLVDMSRSAQAGFNKGNVHPIPLPLPPLEQQKRIVAKVDELMALCDDLETQRHTRTTARKTFTAASLHHVTHAEDANDLRQHWQHIHQNFTLFTTTPQDVGELRKVILQLAVQGKLVPQDPTDEPASVLLEKIKAEKARLVKAKQIKKSKPLPPVEADEVPFGLPVGWSVARLGEIVLDFQNGLSKRKSDKGQPVPVLRLADIKNGRISESDLRHIKLTETELQKYRASRGDVLVIRVNGSADLVGRFIPVDVDRDLAYSDHLIRVTMSKEYVNPHFITLYSGSSLSRNHFEAKTITTAGQKTVNQTGLGSLPVPLPPLNEQKRIVAKVDELMALCDSLEADINQAQQDASVLLEATVKSLLAA
jgi:type I restriction enzyme S subunit